MTKNVRVENADTSAHKLKVSVYDKGPDGVDVLSGIRVLDNPTDLAEFYVTSTRYITVEEYTDEQPKV